jgi:hypothetical protein
MTLILTQTATVVAGLALVASAFTVSPRRGLLPGMVGAVVLAVAAALLITAARAFG